MSCWSPHDETKKCKYSCKYTVIASGVFEFEFESEGDDDEIRDEASDAFWSNLESLQIEEEISWIVEKINE